MSKVLWGGIQKVVEKEVVEDLEIIMKKEKGYEVNDICVRAKCNTAVP